MIKRIVKMTFRPDKANDFAASYEKSRNTILSFDGIHQLELFKSSEMENVLFTISEWEDEKALNKYRKSAFFKEMWSKTKVGFQAPAEAWSVVKY